MVWRISHRKAKGNASELLDRQHMPWDVSMPWLARSQDGISLRLAEWTHVASSFKPGFVVSASVLSIEQPVLRRELNIDLPQCRGQRAVPSEEHQKWPNGSQMEEKYATVCLLLVGKLHIYTRTAQGQRNRGCRL